MPAGIGTTCGDDFVQRGDRVASADLAGVLLVVVEVFATQQPVFVADEAIAGDVRRVELDLQFDVLRDRHQRAARLSHEHLACLLQRIEVGVIAVPLIGEHLHRRVLQVARADTEH